MIRKFLMILFLLCVPAGLFAQSALPESSLLLQKNDSPLIAFRILFQTGSAADPKGKEGLAELTSALISGGSTTKNDYQKILEMLFPMAAGYSSQVDKEITVFTGITHKDHLVPYYALLRDAILSPAFKQEDFDRIKTDQLNYVTRTLRFNNDEELGKETLAQAIFQNHPYKHPSSGIASALQSMTVQDVKDFYSAQYTQKNVWIGVSGNFTDEFLAQLQKDFAALPAGKETRVQIPEPSAIQGTHLVLVEKETPATAISFGFPIPVTRAQDDYYALLVMNTWLGQHRNQFSHLYQVMRGARGLNYGDYSYIEHYPLAGRSIQPAPNVGRHQQIFQVWIRPVQNQNRHFALRLAIRELQALIDNGLTKEDFELARTFALNNTVSFALSNSEQLGYALDDRFYGLKTPYLENVKQHLGTLKLEDVNAAIKKYLNTSNLIIAAVTQDAEAFRKAVLENTPSPIAYESPKPQLILDQDKLVEKYPLTVKPESVKIIPVSKMFE